MRETLKDKVEDVREEIEGTSQQIGGKVRKNIGERQAHSDDPDTKVQGVENIVKGQIDETLGELKRKSG